MVICKQQIPAGNQIIAGFLFLFLLFFKYSSLQPSTRFGYIFFVDNQPCGYIKKIEKE